MATRTVAAGGGNWNSTATWVGGVVPIAADDVVADATSGQLTINVTTALNISFNFTGYTNTLTINSGIIMYAQRTCTFGSGMTIAGAGKIALNSTVTLTSNGKTVPIMQFTNGATKTLADNASFTTLETWGANATTTCNGFQISTANLNLGAAGGGGTTGVLQGTTTILVTGTNCTIGQYNYNLRLTNALTVNASGTVTITGGITFSPLGSFTWTAGTLAGDKNLFFGGVSQPNGNQTIDIANAGTWDKVYFGVPTSNNVTMTLNSNINSNNFYYSKQNATIQAARYYIDFVGTGVLNGGTLWTFPAYEQDIAGTNGWPITQTQRGTWIRFANGSTHTFSGIYLYGMSTSDGLIQAASGTASINFTGPISEQVILFTDFTNINATGNTLYTYRGGLSGTTNIQVANNYLPTQGYSFVN